MIHCVGYAHLDPVYMWRWQEGAAEGRATLRAAVNLLSEEPETTFVTTTAWLFRQVAAVDPGLIEEVRALVEAGRWELIGGMWVEADVNIPGGESLVRQVLLGQHTFRELFGVTARAGGNPDSFGHCEGLPQVLRKAGLESYVFVRPMTPDRPIPLGVFQWEGVDGSRVPAYRLRAYASRPDRMAHAFHAAEERLVRDTDAALVFYGVGNHGGGPTRENIRAIKAYAEAHPEREVRFSGLAAFFDATNCESKEVYDAGLLHWGRGCYSARSELKALCRRSEIALFDAERLGACVEALGVRKSAPGPLRDAWERLLFNQFHDILSGTSIQESSRDDRDAFGFVLTVAEEEFNAAWQSLASMTDTGGAGPAVHAYSGEEYHLEYAQGVPVVLVNQQPWDYDGPIELELHDWRAEPAVCLGPDGEERPVQIGPGYGYPGSRLRRQLACFEAQIPAGGFAVCTIQRREAKQRSEPVRATGLTLENAVVRVDWAPDTGCLTRLEDKSNGLCLDFGEGGNDLLVLHDSTDTWGVDPDGSSVREFGPVKGHFALRGIHVQEAGPVKATVRISRAYGSSVAEQFVTLFERSPVVRVRTRLLWNEPQCVLKAAFPIGCSDGSVWSEIPAGAANRGTADGEWPCQKWIEAGGVLDGHPCGLALINDSKYAYDFKDGSLRLTLVRSPNWAFMYNNEEVQGRHYKVQDLGYHEFTYWLWLHAGDWHDAHVPRLAEVLNNPPYGLPEHCHPGPLGRAMSLLRCSEPNVSVSALKRSEDEARWIVRTFETEGRQAKVKLSWDAAGVSWEFETNPFEIRTFAVNPGRKEVVECDLLEDNLVARQGTCE